MSTASPRPRVLFLAHLLPWPLEGGGQIKSYHTLRHLASKYEVTLFALLRNLEESAQPLGALDALMAYPSRMMTLSRNRVLDAAWAMQALLLRQSFVVRRDHVRWLRENVQGELDRQDYAVLHVDHLQMMQFVPRDVGRTRVVLDTHNVEHRLIQHLADAPTGNPLTRWYAGQEWPKLREFERSAVRRADLTLSVSEADAEELRTLAPERADSVVTVQIGVDTTYFVPMAREAGSRTLLFVGTLYWPPNIDALRYFCREILPRIRAHIPDVRLRVVGIRPTTSVRALAADPSVTVVGHVPDIRPYAADCGAFVVPLRWGSGMRVKILNAMAMGLPVVSTTVGAEGIDITDGQDILIADEPAAFADAVVRVLKAPALGGELGTAARHLMETRYAWEVIGPRLLSAYAERVLAPSGATEGR